MSPELFNIISKWDGIKPETVEKVMNDKTIITLATLSLYRYKNLFRTLTITPQNTVLPLNICLRVQAAEEMPVDLKQELITLLEKHYQYYDLQFTYKNHGSGIPRRDVVHRARDHFNADYILTLDDDMILPNHAIEVMVAILMDHKNLGTITIRHTYQKKLYKLNGNEIKGIESDNVFDLVDCIGSGATMMRKEILHTSDLDPNYYVGWGDFDFSMQLREAGWELGVLNIEGFKSINSGKNTLKYLAIRKDKENIKNSYDRFNDKWGVILIP